MSNQYPGQPGDLPPTQVAPGNLPPQQPGVPQGYPQQPSAPYGAPGGGGGYPPPPFGAPPTGGGGGKKVAVIIAIIVAVLVLIGGGIVAAILVFGGDDDESDGAGETVTVTRTAETSDATASTSDVTVPTTDVTTTAGTDAPPVDDAEITAQAYLNSLVEGNCLAVEGLSTPEWFASEYGNQRGCRQAAGNQAMSTAVYEDFAPPIDNGDGSITLTTTVSDSSDTSGTTYTGTWVLVPSDDNTTWLVSGFQLV